LSPTGRWPNFLIDRIETVGTAAAARLRVNHFDPSIARARECRQAMDEALWSSARELLAEIADGDDAAEPAVSRTATDSGPTGLLDYGAYFDLALTPPAETEVPAAAKAAAIAHLRRRLTAADEFPPTAAPPRISNFSGDHYSTDELERMRRWWDIEPANRMGMIAATDEDYARSCRLIEVAMAHLSDAAPELHGEVETIIRDIVLAQPDGSGRFTYGGASSFALWGALTINVEPFYEWMQFYRQIVHETAHNLLFGIARVQPLVMDDPADRTPSPIRADPRPMDGIFHAAFVSAREAIAFDKLLCRHEAAGSLSAEDAAVIEDLLELSVLAFWDCIETLRGDAQLTGLGDAVLADCEAYMTANFAVEPC
jgi:HEXXH motif-containing protein